MVVGEPRQVIGQRITSGSGEDAGLPHLPMFYVAVIWFASLGICGCVIRLLDR